MLKLIDIKAKTIEGRLKFALLFLEQDLSIWYYNETEIYLN